MKWLLLISLAAAPEYDLAHFAFAFKSQVECHKGREFAVEKMRASVSILIVAECVREDQQR